MRVHSGLQVQRLQDHSSPYGGVQRCVSPQLHLSAKEYGSKWRQDEFNILCTKSVQGWDKKAFWALKPANEWITKACC